MIGVECCETTLTTGYHVLRVLANSPAANAGIEPWFDYLCGVNSLKIVPDPSYNGLISRTIQMFIC